jgi:calcium/calmodulin-dependent protein kinase I
MICDFGLSRVIESDKMALLTEICGTPGYMAPEIFLKSGHHKPVDVWAMGVITYFLLCGYTPFDRDSQAKETEAIIAGDYKFEPAEYWENVSQTAREFIQCCLTINPAKRPTAQEILDHKWLSSEHYVTDHTGAAADLLPQVKKNFDAKKTFRKAVFTMMAMKRMTTLASLSPGAEDFNRNLQQYKEESEKEAVDENEHVFHHDGTTDEDGKKADEVLSAGVSKLSVNDKSKAN